jgi:hypothetical protein
VEADKPDPQKDLPNVAQRIESRYWLGNQLAEIGRAYMADAQHIQWLLEGPEAWNARRQSHSFRPDFRDAEFFKINAENKLAETNDNLMEVVGTKSSDDLIGSRRSKKFADFRSTNMRDSDLRSADLEMCDFQNADLSNADVRTLYDSDGRRRQTDLSKVAGLTQEQINSMSGDRGVILPQGLEYPPDWLEASSPVRDNSHRQASRQAVQAGLFSNRPAVILITASVLEQVSAFRESVRGNNHLASKEPEIRASLLSFLDALSTDLDRLLAIIPPDEIAPTMEAAEEAASWLDRFGNRFRDNLEKYVHPDNVADATLPLGIILGCGAIGALLGGPIGFGAGSVVGNYLTNNLKPGAVVDKIEELLEQDSGGRQ